MLARDAEATAPLDTRQLDGELLGAITSLPSIAPTIFADVLKGFLGEKISMRSKIGRQRQRRNQCRWRTRPSSPGARDLGS